MSTDKEETEALITKIDGLVPDEVDALLERVVVVLSAALDGGGDGSLIEIDVPLGEWLCDYEQIANAIRVVRKHAKRVRPINANNDPAEDAMREHRRLERDDSEEELA